MGQQVLKSSNEKMEKAVAAYSRELATVRAGRASSSVLDKVQVDYYGAPTPVVQLANITVPEARLLVIQPYDKTSIGDIEKALLKADLGLNPSNDGSVIRIAFPALTEARRRDLVKTYFSQKLRWCHDDLNFSLLFSFHKIKTKPTYNSVIFTRK